MKTKNTLIFVYNANSGLFNTITDIAHKAFSPNTYSCNLCKISHDLFREKKDWKNFIISLKVTCTFMHKNEFIKKYPSEDIQFPAVFLQKKKEISVVLSENEINGCVEVQDLKNKIKNILQF